MKSQGETKGKSKLEKRRTHSIKFGFVFLISVFSSIFAQFRISDISICCGPWSEGLVKKFDKTGIFGERPEHREGETIKDKRS